MLASPEDQHDGGESHKSFYLVALVHEILIVDLLSPLTCSLPYRTPYRVPARLSTPPRDVSRCRVWEDEGWERCELGGRLK